LQKKDKEDKKKKDKAAKADEKTDKPAPPKFGKDPVLFSVRVHVRSVQLSAGPLFSQSCQLSCLPPRMLDAERVTVRITVQVIEARELKSRDAGGTSDPICFVTVHNQKQKTSVIKATLNAMWVRDITRIRIATLDTTLWITGVPGPRFLIISRPICCS
jgi:hypothetical protein